MLFGGLYRDSHVFCRPDELSVIGRRGVVRRWSLLIQRRALRPADRSLIADAMAASFMVTGLRYRGGQGKNALPATGSGQLEIS